MKDKQSKIYVGSSFQAAELTVETDGLSFDVIFGACDAGHFIAIPNFGVSVPAAVPNDAFYNAERLAGCKNDFVSENADTLAIAVAAAFGEDSNED